MSKQDRRDPRNRVSVDPIALIVGFALVAIITMAVVFGIDRADAAEPTTTEAVQVLEAPATPDTTEEEVEDEVGMFDTAIANFRKWTREKEDLEAQSANLEQQRLELVAYAASLDQANADLTVKLEQADEIEKRYRDAMAVIQQCSGHAMNVAAGLWDPSFTTRTVGNLNNADGIDESVDLGHVQ